MTVRVRIHLGAIPRRLAEDPELVPRARQAAVRAAGPYVQRVLALNTPSGVSGNARQAVTFEEGPRPGEGFVGYAAPASTYIQFANDGTRPHTPPWQPVALWAIRKGLNPGKVWWGIRRHGTKAQKFVEKTALQVEAPIQKIMGDAVMEALTGGRNG